MSHRYLHQGEIYVRHGGGYDILHRLRPLFVSCQKNVHGVWPMAGA